MDVLSWVLIWAIQNPGPILVAGFVLLVVIGAFLISLIALALTS